MGLLLLISPSEGGDPNLSAAGSPDDEPAPVSFDLDPADRRVDRLLAYLGVLEDTAPLFRSGPRVPHAGVLLALPALVASGVFTVPRQVYGSLGPAFYGLRTTLVTLLLMALLRIKRPEGLKEHPPGDLGRVVGLDRAPEEKTLRRKLRRLRPRPGRAPGGRPRGGAGLPLRRWTRAGLPRPADAAEGARRPAAPGDAGDHRLLGQRYGGRTPLCRHGRGECGAGADAAGRPRRLIGDPAVLSRWTESDYGPVGPGGASSGWAERGPANAWGSRNPWHGSLRRPLITVKTEPRTSLICSRGLSGGAVRWGRAAPVARVSVTRPGGACTKKGTPHSYLSYAL